MTKGHSLSGRLLGDASSNAVITMPDGTQLSIPAGDVPAFFAGDLDDGDDDDHPGFYAGDSLFGDSLFGDPRIVSFDQGFDEDFEGDMYEGGPRKMLKKLGGKVKNTVNRVARGVANKTAAKTSTPDTQVKYGQFLPVARGAISGTKEDKLIASAAAAIPGAVFATKNISPLILNNAFLNNAPTRAMIQGSSFLQSVQRFETQYPGSTRTQQNPSASGTATFTFAAPTVAEGGNVTRTPVVFLQIGIQRNSAVSGANIGISLSGVNDGGTAIDSRQWTFVLKEQLDSIFVAFVPFIEVSSQIYPSIASADVTNPLLVNVYGLPANTNVRVFIPGMDSSQYENFKKGFGISSPTSQLIRG